MAVLLTGGTGKTSSRISSLLSSSNPPIPHLIASRNPPASSSAVKFDWLDPHTFPNPFSHALPSDVKITAIYLVAPNTPDPSEVMINFIDYAVKQHNVKRFVLLTGSNCEIEGHPDGKVWKHLITIGVEWAVLRATWFMENFVVWGNLVSIRDESKFYTASGDGKIPFVSADDIAAVAYRALTNKHWESREMRVLGGELLSHDQLAAELSAVLGRKITHVKLSGDERQKQMEQQGVPEYLAKMLANVEVQNAGGTEERKGDAVEKVTGKKPKAWKEFAEENKSKWER